MNNSFRRLLSMVIALTMCVSSLNIISVSAADAPFFGSNEVISGSGISVAGFSSNPITSDSTFEPNSDPDIASYGVPAPVTGYYSMNNITLLGSPEAPASIDTALIGGSQFADGSSFNYTARFLDASTDEGNVIAFATDSAANVTIYATPMSAGTVIGITDGIAPSVASESDFISGACQAAEAANAATIYEFSVMSAGQYAIAATGSYDIYRVNVSPRVNMSPESVEVLNLLGGTSLMASSTSTVTDPEGTLAEGTYTFDTNSAISPTTTGITFNKNKVQKAVDTTPGYVKLKRESSDVDGCFKVKPAVTGTLTLTTNGTSNGITVYVGGTASSETLAADKITTNSTDNTFSFDVTKDTLYLVHGGSSNATQVTHIKLTAGSGETSTEVSSEASSETTTVSFQETFAPNSLTAGTITGDTIYGKFKFIYSEDTKTAPSIKSAAKTTAITLANGSSITPANVLHSGSAGSSTNRAIQFTTSSAGSLYVYGLGGGSAARDVKLNNGTDITPSSTATQFPDSSGTVTEVYFNDLAANTTYNLYASGGGVEYYYIGYTGTLAELSTPTANNLVLEETPTGVTGTISGIANGDTLAVGNVKTFTVTAPANYTVQSVTFNGNAITADANSGEYSITAVEGDNKVAVTYASVAEASVTFSVTGGTDSTLSDITVDGVTIGTDGKATLTIGPAYTVTSSKFDVKSVTLDSGTGSTDGATFTPDANTTTVAVTLADKAEEPAQPTTWNFNTYTSVPADAENNLGNGLRYTGGSGKSSIESYATSSGYGPYTTGVGSQTADGFRPGGAPSSGNGRYFTYTLAAGSTFTLYFVGTKTSDSVASIYSGSTYSGTALTADSGSTTSAAQYALGTVSYTNNGTEAVTISVGATNQPVYIGAMVTGSSGGTTEKTATATFNTMTNGSAAIDGVTANAHGSYTLTQGTAYTVTATPDSGYELDTITAVGATVSGTTITPTAATVTITVTFKQTTQPDTPADYATVTPTGALATGLEYVFTGNADYNGKKLSATEPTAIQAYAMTDAADNYVTFDNTEGLVVTDNSSASNAAYLPFADTLPTSGTLVITGTSKLSDDCSNAINVVRLGTDGSGIRYNGGKLYLYNGSSATTDGIAYTVGSDFTYTWTIDLATKASTLDIGGTTISQDVTLPAKAMVSLNTGSTATFDNYCKNIKFTLTEASTDVTVTATGVKIMNGATEVTADATTGKYTLQKGVTYTVSTSGASALASLTAPAGTKGVTIAAGTNSGEFTLKIDSTFADSTLALTTKFLGDSTKTYYKVYANTADATASGDTDFTANDTTVFTNAGSLGSLSNKLGTAYSGTIGDDDLTYSINYRYQTTNSFTVKVPADAVGESTLYIVASSSGSGERKFTLTAADGTDLTNGGITISTTKAQLITIPGLAAGTTYTLSASGGNVHYGLLMLETGSLQSTTENVEFVIYSGDGNVTSAVIYPENDSTNKLTVENGKNYDLAINTRYMVEPIDTQTAYTVVVPADKSFMTGSGTSSKQRKMAITMHLGGVDKTNRLNVVGSGNVTDAAGLVFDFVAEANKVTHVAYAYKEGDANLAEYAVYSKVDDDSDYVLYDNTIGMSVVNSNIVSNNAAFLPLKTTVNNGVVTITGVIKLTDDGVQSGEVNVVAFGRESDSVAIQYSGSKDAFFLYDGNGKTSSGSIPYIMGHDAEITWTIDIHNYSQSLSVDGSAPITQAFTTAQTAQGIVLRTNETDDFNIRCKNMTIKHVPEADVFNITGTVKNTSGDLLSGIKVRVVINGEEYNAVTTDGVYTLSNLPTSSSKLTVTATDSTDTYVGDTASIAANNTEDQIIDFTLNTKASSSGDEYVWDFVAKNALPTSADGTIYTVSGNMGTDSSSQPALKVEGSTSITVAYPVAGTLTIYTDPANTCALKDAAGNVYTADKTTGIITISLDDVIDGGLTLTRSNSGTKARIQKLVFAPTDTSSLGTVSGKVTYLDEDGNTVNASGVKVLITDSTTGDTIKECVVGTDGTYTTGLTMKAGSYIAKVENTTDFIGASAEVAVTAGLTTTANLVLTLRSTTAYAVTLNVTNNTATAGSIGVHDNAAASGVNVTNVAITADTSQTYTIELPSGDYTLFINGIENATISAGNTFSVADAAVTVDLTIDIDTTTLTPIAADTTYNFGSTTGYISATNDSFELSGTTASSKYVKLDSDASYVEFKVDKEMKVTFNVDSKDAVLLYTVDGSTKALNRNADSSYILQPGTYRIETGTSRLVSITTATVQYHGGIFVYTNNSAKDVTITFTGTSGQAYSYTATANTVSGTISATDIPEDTYTLSVNSGELTGITSCTIDVDEFHIEGIVIDPMVNLTVKFVGLTSSGYIKFSSIPTGSTLSTGNNTTADHTDTNIKPGAVYKYTGSSSTLNSWEPSVTSSAGSTDPGKIVAYNGPSGSDRYFTYTVPSTAQDGDVYTITFSSADKPIVINNHNVSDAPPEVGYGQYGFGGEKQTYCGAKDVNEGRNILTTAFLPSTMKDYNLGAYTHNYFNTSAIRGSAQFETNQISDTAPKSGSTTKYELGNEFGILGTDKGNSTYVKFTVNVNGRVYCKVDSSKGSVKLYELNADGTKGSAAVMVGDSGSKAIYSVKSGTSYIVVNEGSANAYLKSVRLFDPDNVFTNIDPNGASTATPAATYTAGLVTGDLKTKLSLANGDSNKVFRLIGKVTPILGEGSLAGALKDITAIGWVIVDKACVDAFNDAYVDGEKTKQISDYYFNPNELTGIAADSSVASTFNTRYNTQNVGEITSILPDIATTERVNSGVLKITAEGSDFNNITKTKDIASPDDLEVGSISKFADSFDTAYSVNYVRVAAGKSYYAFPYTKGIDGNAGYTIVARRLAYDGMTTDKQAEITHVASTADEALRMMGAVLLEG